MIDFADLDMMARGGSLAFLLLGSWLIYRDYRAEFLVRLALLMNAAFCCHIIANIPRQVPQPSLGFFLLELGDAAAPGLFWLLARVWFDDEDRIGWQSWLLIAASVTLDAFTVIMPKSEQPAYFLFDISSRLSWLAFAIAAMWTAWRGRSNDLVEARLRFRTRFVVVVAGYVLLVVGTSLIDPQPNMISQAANLCLTLLAGAAAANLMTIKYADLIGAHASEAQPAEPIAIDDPLANRLLAFMEHQKPHRNERLTIAALAAQLDEQEYRLRRLINGQLGYRNFATFLNGYRLAEVKAALRDPEQKDVPILTIALDAGFGSLGPFNRAFRKAEGCTPSAYRKDAAG
jgi:AraC-like DNA-binding protein